jgi:uroporphyrinogen-III synthase
MKLVITRPRMDADILAQKLLAMGHAVVVAPVLEIIARQNLILPDLKFQAICLTSANGIRSFNGILDFSLPLFAVGQQSAAAARHFGFQNITTQGGDVHGLVKYLRTNLQPSDGPLLYISGAETSGDLEGQLTQAGFNVHRMITYDAIEQNLAPFRDEIAVADGVLLYSPRSAKLWKKQLLALKLAEKMKAMAHFCLSPQIASILSPNSHIVTPNSPSEDAMLTLLEARISDKA